MNNNNNTRKGSMANETRAISILVSEAPAVQSAIEFTKNVFDFDLATKLEISSIKIGKAFKAVYRNDGGIDDKVMYDLGSIFGDPKMENGKSKDNYNTGARVMGLKANEAGLVFITQYEGVISCTRLYLDKGVFMIADNEEKFLKLFTTTKRDWTRVVLMGNSVGQDTFTMPYGNAFSKAPLYEQLSMKFATMPKRVSVVGEVVVPLYDYFKRKAIKSWSVPATKKVNGKVCEFVIHYTIVPPKSKKAVSGIALYNENGYTQVFDAYLNKGSSSFAKSSMNLVGALGAIDMVDELSVIVELDKNKYDVGETQYRTNLQTSEGSPVEMLDFIGEVVAYVPIGLRAIIDERAKEVVGRDVKTATTAIAAALVKAMGVDLNTFVANRTGDVKRKVKKHINPNENGGGGKGGKGDNEPNINDTEDDTSKDEPTPVEKKRGLPKFNAKRGDDAQFDDLKKDLVTVDYHNVYFNYKHPIFNVVHTAVSKKMKTTKIVSSEVFSRYLAEQMTLLLAYKLDGDGYRAAALALGVLSLGTGEFIKNFGK